MPNLTKYLEKHIRICNAHGHLQILKPGEDPDGPHQVLEFADAFEKVQALRKHLFPLFEDYAAQYAREQAAQTGKTGVAERDMLERD